MRHWLIRNHSDLITLKNNHMTAQYKAVNSGLLGRDIIHCLILKWCKLLRKVIFENRLFIGAHTPHRRVKRGDTSLFSTFSQNRPACIPSTPCLRPEVSPWLCSFLALKDHIRWANHPDTSKTLKKFNSLGDLVTIQGALFENKLYE